MSSLLIPEAGSPTAVALALSQKMDADVELKIVPVPDNPTQYGVQVSGGCDLTKFYEKILPKGGGGGRFGDDADSYFIWDDWTHEREFFEEEHTEHLHAPLAVDIPQRTWWQRILGWFAR